MANHTLYPMDTNPHNCYAPNQEAATTLKDYLLSSPLHGPEDPTPTLTPTQKLINEFIGGAIHLRNVLQEHSTTNYHCQTYNVTACPCIAIACKRLIALAKTVEEDRELDLTIKEDMDIDHQPRQLKHRQCEGPIIKLV